MLYLASKLQNLGLYTIRLGGCIGNLNKPIVNPHNLHIDGFYCILPNNPEDQIILDIDIRDLSLKGAIINNHEDVSQAEDLVRLKEVLDLNYNVIGKSVYAGNKKIGKVSDYAIDNKSLFIIKLYVQPPVWQALTAHELVVDRSSILEVSESKIIISGPEEKSKEIADQKANSRLNQSLSSASSSLIRE